MNQNILKLSFQTSPRTSTITTTTTLHGTTNTCLFSPHHRRFAAFRYGLHPVAMTSLRAHIDHKCHQHHHHHQVICSHASLPEKNINDKWFFKPEKVIIGVAVIGLCVFSSVISRRYETSRIMINPILPHFAWGTQALTSPVDTERDKFTGELFMELDRLIELGRALNESPASQPPPSEVKKMVKYERDVADAWKKIKKEEAGSEHYLLLGLATVDILIEKGQYEKAEEICSELDELFFQAKRDDRSMDSRVALRTFIALAGQAKKYLEQYVGKSKSLQQKKIMTSKIPSIKREIENELTHFEELIGKMADEFKFMQTMLRAQNQLKEYIAIEREKPSEEDFFEDIEKKN